MKRTPMVRTPFRRKPVVIEDKIIAGKHWPYAWMSEKDFQAHVESIAHGYGWMTSHAHLPFFDTAGTPDLLIVHPKTGRTIFAELKVRGKTGNLPKPTPAQYRWLAALGLKNETYVWSWPDDDEAVYAELAKPGQVITG